jgi:hypothetical protein
VRKLLIGGSVAALALIVAAVAVAATVQTISASVSTGSGKPKAGKVGTTSINISAKDAANQPSQQPDPARKIDFRLPKGLKLDTKAAPTCSASDVAIQQNPNACPSNTQIAKGSAVVNTGLAPPVTTFSGPVKGYNGGKSLILVAVVQGTTIVIRTQITGSASKGFHLVAPVKPNCLPPGTPSDNPPCGGKEAPIQSFTLTTLNKHKGSGKNRHDLLTAPPTCPKKGWTFGVHVTFRSIPAQDVTTQVACRK